MKKSILFLLIMLLTSLAVHAQDTPQSEVKMIYWSEDKSKCAVCDKVVIEGTTYFIFNTLKFDLVFSGIYNKKLIFSPVYILNKSTERIEFDPSLSSIALYKKKTEKPIEFWPLTPETAAKKMKGSERVKNFLTALGGGMAQRTATVDSTSSGNVSVMDNRGNSATGVYNGQTTSTVSVPDVDAQRNARDVINERNRQASERENSYLSSALRANTIFPDKDVSGNIYFEKGKGEFFWLAIRVGDERYVVGFEFPN